MDRLKAIETFVHIARTGSLTRAAAELDISRALASTHLKQLEAFLGVRLINRTTRHLALTEIGTEYLRFAKKALDSFDEETAAISKWHDNARGHLKILTSTSFGNFRLGPIVPAFLKQFPEIEISLMVTDTHVSGPDLIDRGFDLAFTMQLLDDASIVCTRVADVCWLPWASPGYINEHGEPRAPQDLTRHNCLVHRSVSPDGIWRLSRRSEVVPIKVRGSFVTNTVVPLASMVAAGLGIGLLPAYCIEDEVAAGTIVRILNAYAGPSRTAYAIYPHARYLPKKVRAFLDFTKAALGGAPR